MNETVKELKKAIENKRKAEKREKEAKNAWEESKKRLDEAIEQLSISKEKATKLQEELLEVLSSVTTTDNDSDDDDDTTTVETIVDTPESPVKGVQEDNPIVTLEAVVEPSQGVTEESSDSDNGSKIEEEIVVESAVSTEAVAAESVVVVRENSGNKELPVFDVSESVMKRLTPGVEAILRLEENHALPVTVEDFLAELKGSFTKRQASGILKKLVSVGWLEEYDDKYGLIVVEEEDGDFSEVDLSNDPFFGDGELDIDDLVL